MAPTYDYECPDCGKVVEVIHKISESPEVKCACGTEMKKRFTPNRVGFAIKGGTDAIHWREKRLRMKKREQIDSRKRWGTGPKIKPNIAGIEQESWADCQKLAKECGLDANSYDPIVEKEKKPKIFTGPVISC